MSCQQSEEVRLLAVNLNTSLSFRVERRAAVRKRLNMQTSYRKVGAAARVLMVAQAHGVVTQERTTKTAASIEAAANLYGEPFVNQPCVSGSRAVMHPLPEIGAKCQEFMVAPAFI